MDLGRKVTIVTGAGQWIGRGIALHLASAGTNLALADLDIARVEAVTMEIEDLGFEAIPIQADVSNSVR